MREAAGLIVSQIKEESSNSNKPNTMKDFVKFDTAFTEKLFKVKQECIVIGSVVKCNPTNLVKQLGVQIYYHILDCNIPSTQLKHDLIHVRRNERDAHHHAGLEHDGIQ
jgi:hypothetical protein